MKYVAENTLLFSSQHGFQRGRSCETQLFELTTEIDTNLHELTQTDAVFIDFEKAFDRVGHIRWIHKMKTCQIDTQVID